LNSIIEKDFQGEEALEYLREDQALRERRKIQIDKYSSAGKFRPVDPVTEAGWLIIPCGSKHFKLKHAKPKTGSNAITPAEPGVLISKLTNNQTKGYYFF
jgi:UDP-N-acetylenolpyruvoylglucosamine reductase